MAQKSNDCGCDKILPLVVIDGMTALPLGRIPRAPVAPACVPLHKRNRNGLHEAVIGLCTRLVRVLLQPYETNSERTRH